MTSLTSVKNLKFLSSWGMPAESLCEIFGWTFALRSALALRCLCIALLNFGLLGSLGGISLRARACKSHQNDVQMLFKMTFKHLPGTFWDTRVANVAIWMSFWAPVDHFWELCGEPLNPLGQLWAALGPLLHPCWTKNHAKSV